MRVNTLQAHVASVWSAVESARPSATISPAVRDAQDELKRFAQLLSRRNMLKYFLDPLPADEQETAYATLGLLQQAPPSPGSEEPIQIIKKSADRAVDAFKFFEAASDARDFAATWAPDDFLKILKLWAHDRRDIWRELCDLYVAALYLVASPGTADDGECVDRFTSQDMRQAVSLLHFAAEDAMTSTRAQLHRDLVTHSEEASRTHASVLKAALYHCTWIPHESGLPAVRVPQILRTSVGSLPKDDLDLSGLVDEFLNSMNLS